MRVNGIITFTTDGKKYKASDRFEMAFRLKKDLLISGRISGSVDMYEQDKPYEVEVKFFTTNKHALEHDYGVTINQNDVFAVCAGKYIVGNFVVEKVQ